MWSGVSRIRWNDEQWGFYAWWLRFLFNCADSRCRGNSLSSLCTKVGKMSRIVCRFSCGAASAVATKLALEEFPKEQVVIVNAYIEDEHLDNRRFAEDCEVWFDHPITVLRDTKFSASPREVWRKERFMVSRAGASCSRALKGKLLDAFRQPGDISILGYTAEEQGRFDKFFDRMSDTLPRAPLIERGLMKADCLAIIERAGIRLPKMYELGYRNANCIGCPKGGAGYWNKIKIDFPARFAEIADIQEDLGSGANFLRNSEGKYLSLKELPIGMGRHQDEPEISCGFSCEIALADIEAMNTGTSMELDHKARYYAETESYEE